MAEPYKGFAMTTWYGLAGPKKLPAPIVERLSTEVQAIHKQPEVVKRFDELDAVISPGGPKEFGDFWRAEVARYTKLIADAKIRA